MLISKFSPLKLATGMRLLLTKNMPTPMSATTTTTGRVMRQKPIPDARKAANSLDSASSPKTMIPAKRTATGTAMGNTAALQ